VPEGTLALARRARTVMLPHLSSRLTLAFAAATALLACGRNPYDPTQVPRVVATTGGTAALSISWQPEGAQLVRVYRGATAGDGYTLALVWSVAATARNSLASPVPYGSAAPAGGSTDRASSPLVPGEVYTVQVTRQDPKGTGDGFTNTANRYVGTVTFTAAAP
jgi:hypothetical protein